MGVNSSVWIDFFQNFKIEQRKRTDKNAQLLSFCSSFGGTGVGTAEGAFEGTAEGCFDPEGSEKQLVLQ